MKNSWGLGGKWSRLVLVLGAPRRRSSSFVPQSDHQINFWCLLESRELLLRFN